MRDLFWFPQVQAGADMVAPSDMMDGRVAAIRRMLDQNGYSHTPIMSYAVKFASSFYGPFRDAAGSAPAFGDRKSYQMDYHNRREAIKEAMLDVEEGADILMVKPAMAYGDLIREVKDTPSIISEGATISAPACTCDSAVLARNSRVLSLSTSWPQRMPQWPWEVYSHMQTSPIRYSSGAVSFALRKAFWTIPSSA